MRKSFTFNNERKDWIYTLSGLERPPFAPINRNLLNAPHMNGAYLSSTNTEPLIISLPIGFKVKDVSNEMYPKEELAKWLFTEKPAPLIFDDEPNRTYFAVVQNTMEDFQEFANFNRGTIQFLCLDPYKYGPEQTYELEDIAMVENKGTAPADPIFELTAKKKATFAMVSLGADEDSEYNLIGTPADVDEKIVDSRILTFNERGETLELWDAPGSKFDNGKVTGDQMGTDGSGIHPLSYGDAGYWQDWYGPAIMREIDPIQDFEVEMRLRVNTNNPNELYRIEFYLYDENMEVLGKMAIRDFSLSMQRYAAEGRIGPFLGAGKNYLISQANYLREASHFHGMVRMRRIGQEFQFYVARLKTGENEGYHHDVLEEVYRDANNEYQGRLKYVQINIARHAQGARASVPRINAIKVTELKEVKVDETPYILDVGDVVTFDHKNDEVLVNGELRPDLITIGAFGSSFFKLPKGFNNVIVTPSDTFDTTVKFRDKFR